MKNIKVFSPNKALGHYREMAWLPFQKGERDKKCKRKKERKKKKKRRERERVCACVCIVHRGRDRGIVKLEYLRNTCF